LLIRTKKNMSIFSNSWRTQVICKKQEQVSQMEIIPEVAFCWLIFTCGTHH